MIVTLIHDKLPGRASIYDEVFFVSDGVTPALIGSRTLGQYCAVTFVLIVFRILFNCNGKIDTGFRIKSIKSEEFASYLIDVNAFFWLGGKVDRKAIFCR